MSPILIILIVLGYSLMACLMAAFWSHIPPRRTFQDIICGITWPYLLLLMILVAFINTTVRAVEDQNGEFAGVSKKGRE